MVQSSDACLDEFVAGKGRGTIVLVQHRILKDGRCIVNVAMTEFFQQELIAQLAAKDQKTVDKDFNDLGWQRREPELMHQRRQPEGFKAV